MIKPCSDPLSLKQHRQADLTHSTFIYNSLIFTTFLKFLSTPMEHGISVDLWVASYSWGSLISLLCAWLRGILTQLYIEDWKTDLCSLLQPKKKRQVCLRYWTGCLFSLHAKAGYDLSCLFESVSNIKHKLALFLKWIRYTTFIDLIFPLIPEKSLPLQFK